MVCSGLMGKAWMGDFGITSSWRKSCSLESSGAVSLQARLGFSLQARLSFPCKPGCVFLLQCKLELRAVGGAVDHGTAFGRVAFSCAKDEVPALLPSALSHF